MAATTWDEEVQGFGGGFSVNGGTIVEDFEEYTFRAPRPGFFLGDSFTPTGAMNLVTRLEQEYISDSIPQCAAPRPCLGALRTLPTELLCQILVHLDMCSLLTFRNVNNHTKYLVDTFPPYRSIARFPKLLGAIAALQCRSRTIQAFIHCVFDEHCSICGHFGDLLYMVIPERWCYSCWLKKDQSEVLRVPDSMTEEEVSQAHPQIPNVQLVPGYYGRRGEGVLSRPIRVFDLRAIRHAFPKDRRWKHRYVLKSDPLYYTTIIRAPYWDAHTAKFEEGYFCRACASQGWVHRGGYTLAYMSTTDYPAWDLPWRRYTREGMREHIVRHGTIYKIHRDKGELRYVHERPFACRMWDEPQELHEIALLLRSCRKKEVQVTQGQPLLNGWEIVSSAKKVMVQLLENLE